MTSKYKIWACGCQKETRGKTSRDRYCNTDKCDRKMVIDPPTPSRPEHGGGLYVLTEHEGWIDTFFCNECGASMNEQMGCPKYDGRITFAEAIL